MPNHSVLKGEGRVKALIEQAYRDGERAGFAAGVAAERERGDKAVALLAELVKFYEMHVIVGSPDGFWPRVHAAIRAGAAGERERAEGEADKLRLLLLRSNYCLSISKLKSLDPDLPDEIDAALAEYAAIRAGAAGEREK